MLPMTDEYYDAVAVPGAPELEGFWKAPAGFGSSLAACSEPGPGVYGFRRHCAHSASAVGLTSTSSTPSGSAGTGTPKSGCVRPNE